MYNCYNEAVAWVNKQKKQRIKNTDGYVYIDKHDTIEVKLLMSQYHLGIQVKKELYFKLKDLGVIK